MERERDYGEAAGKAYKLIPSFPSSSKAPASALPTDDAPPSSEKAVFYSSRRGDDWNIRYGGLHRGDIPRYSRFGGGKVLGLNEGLRITKESAYTGRGVEVAPVNQFKTPRYVDSSSYRHLTNRNSKRIVLAPRRAIQVLGEKPEPAEGSEEDEPQPDFLALPRELSSAEKVSKLEHEEGTDYRSITGLVKPSDLANIEDDAEESDDDGFNRLGIAGGESHADHLRRRNLELDRALRDDPRNIQQWLEFVAFQDEVAQSSFSGATSAAAAKRALSKAERASTSEIKLSILERALAAAPENASSEKLLLAQLEAAAEVEDPKKVLERWRGALHDHPELTGLWIEYVSWRQTEWATFEVKQVVGVFEESLEVLRRAMDREDIGSGAREMLEGNAIYLFLRLCLVLRQAGYSERALASFQALVELNLFRPVSLAAPEPYDRPVAWLDHLVRQLETFWDSEAPRIGEKGAKGWGSTSEDDLPPEPPSTSDSDLDRLSQQETGARPHERWAATERLSASNSLPARSTDLGIEDYDDPFRVILYDDIRPFLFVIHSTDSKLQLAYAFLTFLGLPFVPPDYPTSTSFTTDAFIHSELVERPSRIQRFWPKLDAGARARPYETVGGEAMEPERKSAMSEPWEAPFAATPAAVDLLFGPSGGKTGWFKTLRKEDLVDVDVEVARNAFTLLRSAVSDTFLTLDFFSFEAAQSPKNAVKLAKQVLRDRRNELALWDGYARIERQRGKLAEARQVYLTALSMYRSFPESEQIDGPLLWRAWAEMEWEAGRPEVALRVLVAAGGEAQVDLGSLVSTYDDRPSPAQVLRARQHYARSLEASFQPRATQAHLRNRNHLAFASALFEYLTHNLAAAVDILEMHLFRLDVAGANGSAEHEEALIMYAKLLYRHMAVGRGYKPAQLRDLLERAVKEFKNNTLFLSLFYHNERKSSPSHPIQNRFRRTMEELVLKESEATSEGWLFAIYAELHLNVRAVNIHAVRNLFDRALDNPRTRSSPSLFALYIDFEVSNGELARAKSLIYRAMRECPWCKELYLRPFSPALRSVYRSRELRDFHHLLLEKGLRVRVDIDAFLDQYVSSEAEDDEQDEDAPVRLAEAGEELLEERQRLMPY
ncbi:hypothetical protein JCM10213v2_008178 [Rhodosporidiobolus nylandii]